jgi:hypothetical protein
MNALFWNLQSTHKAAKQSPHSVVFINSSNKVLLNSMYISLRVVVCAIICVGTSYVSVACAYICERTFKRKPLKYETHPWNKALSHITAAETILWSKLQAHKCYVDFCSRSDGNWRWEQMSSGELDPNTEKCHWWMITYPWEQTGENFRRDKLGCVTNWE